MAETSLKTWYPKYVGEYRSKTARLSIMDHGVYTLLLDEYYATGEPLPTDLPTLYRICGAQTKKERDSVAKVVQNFFIQTDGVLRNKRADQELLKRSDIREKRQKAAFVKHANAGANAPVLHGIVHPTYNNNNNNNTSVVVPSSTSARAQPAKDNNKQFYDFPREFYGREIPEDLIAKELKNFALFNQAKHFSDVAFNHWENWTMKCKVFQDWKPPAAPLSEADRIRFARTSAGIIKSLGMDSHRARNFLDLVDGIGLPDDLVETRNQCQWQLKTRLPTQNTTGGNGKAPHPLPK